METVVDLPDGSRFIRHGNGLRGTVVIMGRLNFSAGAPVRKRLAAGFEAGGFSFLAFEPAYEAASRRCDPGRFLDGLPAPIRMPLRGLLFLTRRRTWKYLRPAVRRRALSVPFCADSLRRAIQSLAPGPLLLAGYSQGARVAALIADEVGAVGLVCLGYPFRHPQTGEEKARIAHLAELRTPCLIVQGDGDAYGGRDIAGRYALPPSIALEFITADHNYQISEAQWQDIFRRLDGFLARLPWGV